MTHVRGDTGARNDPSGKDERGSSIPAVIHDAAGTYVPSHELGRGAFGTVWCARHHSPSGLEREVAIKILNSGADPTHIARLRDEARILALLDHPVFVRVHDLIRVRDSWALVMERVHGMDIRALLADGGFVPAAAAAVVSRLADALHAAWAHPTPDGSQLCLAHRDLKPANVMIGMHGDMRLLDFGVAWVNLAEREAATVDATVGSLGYMAPERLRGDDHPRSDVYSLGVLWWEMLTGRRYRKMADLQDDHDRHRERALAQIEAPPSLLRTMLQFDADQRPRMDVVAEAAAKIIGSVNVAAWLRRRVAQFRPGPDVDPHEVAPTERFEEANEPLDFAQDALAITPRTRRSSEVETVSDPFVVPLITDPSPTPVSSHPRGERLAVAIAAVALLAAMGAMGTALRSSTVPAIAQPRPAVVAPATAPAIPVTPSVTEAPAEIFIASSPPTPTVSPPIEMVFEPRVPAVLPPSPVPASPSGPQPTPPKSAPGSRPLPSDTRAWVKLVGIAEGALRGDDGKIVALPGVVPPGLYAIVVGGVTRGAVQVRGGEVVTIECAGVLCAKGSSTADSSSLIPQALSDSRH